MNLFLIKILITVIGLGALGGGIFYIKVLVQKNAVLEATLESTTAAMADYAVQVESEINSYQESLSIISSQYQDARDKKYEKIKEVSSMDLSKLIQEDPASVESELNHAVVGLYKELEAITRITTDSTDAIPSEAGAP